MDVRKIGMIALVVVGCVAVAIAGALAFATTKPDTMSIQRETTIDASPERVFALIDDFHNWKQWAPQDMDPNAITHTFSGLPSGVGAVSTWEGKGQIGKGRAEITQSTPGRLVVVRVDFERPFVAHNENRYVLMPEGSGTHVTWSMHGTNPYLAKVMSLVMNMDTMMGKHFETGLANLKAAAEKPI